MRVGRFIATWLGPLACLVALSSLPALAAEDDNIFPPAAAAKPCIDFDGKGFIVRGKRTFLVSGSLHYPRVPRALWRDRLLKMKRAGFNTVQTYVFWNVHEPREGHFDFSGNNDLDAYLTLIKSLGMYATVRVGPYICAEWDSGGFPVWLRFKPGLKLRVDEPQFEAAVDRYYERVFHIVSANQIHRGGSVILVQLENEHPQGWGTSMPNGYFRHLRDKAVSLGLEVPYFFSGLHHGSDPAGFKPWSSEGRRSPWYSTEFWPGWYDLYGPMRAGREKATARGAWKIVAYGGNGYNFYMLHGGTNFGFMNDDETCACYDYAGAIGQAGDLRSIYYDFKRAGMFARTFENILAGGDCSPVAPGDTWRRVGDQSIHFYDTHFAPGFDDPIWHSLAGDIWPDTSGIDLEREHKADPHNRAGDFTHVARQMQRNIDFRSEVRLDAIRTQILGIAKQGKITTVVVYGPPGGQVNVKISQPAPPLPVSMRGPLWSNEVGNVIPTDQPMVYKLNVPYPTATGLRQVRVVVMTAEMANQTWFVDIGNTTYVIYGPDYVGDVSTTVNGLRMDVEEPADRTNPPTEGLVFGPDADPIRIGPVQSQSAHSVLHGSLALTVLAGPIVEPWQVRRADGSAQPYTLDAGWMRSVNPLPMGADGDTSAYAWYRARVTAPAGGAATLHFEDVGDWISVFVNGQLAGSSPVKQRFQRAVPRDFEVNLKAGDNKIAVFAAHMGRHKLFNYLGPMDVIDRKGINGSVTLTTGVTTIPVTGWALHGGIGTPAPSDWRSLEGAPGVPAFFRTRFEYRERRRGDHPVLRFVPTGLSRGFVWLNGHNLGRYPEKTTPVPGLYLPECWLKGGGNELLVFDEEGKSPSGANLIVETGASRVGSVWTTR